MTIIIAVTVITLLSLAVIVLVLLILLIIVDPIFIPSKYHYYIHTYSSFCLLNGFVYYNNTCI